MAPTRSTKNVKSPKLSTKSKSNSKPSSGGLKSKKSTSGISRPPAKQVKTKPAAAQDKNKKSNTKKKSQRTYTEKELGLPALNMITPAGVTKPRGKKKGKIFVDDQESMMTILAMVNAEKEGQIESKIMKARQMEEIREAKRKEAEKRQGERKEKLEATKDSLRKKKKGPSKQDGTADTTSSAAGTKTKSGKKRVSFA